MTTDFSDYSVAAFDYALSLAEVHRAEVHLLHVADKRTHSLESRDESPGQSMSRFCFENTDDFQNIVQVIRFGIPHEEIAHYAKENRIDLIVVATHGRTGLAHVLMGSIAEKVIRHSSVPVLAVKPDAVVEQLITEADVDSGLHNSQRVEKEEELFGKAKRLHSGKEIAPTLETSKYSA